MKPLKLSITGLQSFSKTQVIDFTNLQNNLFLITGETGSGKSTILDAMILALYGKIPRNDYSESKHGLVDNLNKNCSEMEVEFTFKINEDILTIKRGYDYKDTRQNKFQPKNPILTVNDVIVANKTTEISNELSKYFKMSYNDFLKTVILVQNQFSDFIRLANKDKRDMLANIFDLTKYGDHFNKNIREKINTISNEIATVTQEVETTFTTDTLSLLQSQINEADDNLKSRENEIEQLVIKITTTNEIVNNNEKLQTYKQQLDKLETENNKIESQQKQIQMYDSLKLIYTKQEQLVILNDKLKQLEQNKETEHQLQSKLNIDITSLNNDIQKLETNKKQLTDIISNYRFDNNKITDIKVELTKLQQQLTDSKNNELLFTKLNTQKNDLQVTLLDINNKLRENNDKLIKFDNLLLNNQAAKLSEKLEENQPCPVCGSTTHPSLACFTDEYKNEIHEGLMIKKEQLTKTQAETSQQLKTIEEQLSSVETDPSIIPHIEANISQLQIEYQSLKDIESEIENLIVQQNENDKYITDLTIKLNNSKSKLDNSISNLKNIEQQITNNYNEYQKIEIEFNKLLNSETKVSVSSLESYRLTEEQYSQLKETVSEHDDMKIRLTTLISSLSDKVDESVTKQQVVELQNNLTNLRQIHTAEFQIIIKLKQLYEHEKIKYEGTKSHKEILKKLQDKLNNLQLLQNVFKANIFVEYLANAKLQTIVANASNRLYNISNGQFELILVNNIQFELIDNLAAGKARATATLSGGETFIVSLCLALALSNELQVNSQFPIEFFFLDEGFGTLDPNTLSKVLTVLYNIQQQDDLTVGIISHVQYLKENINLKLEVTKSTETSGSTIKINRT